MNKFILLIALNFLVFCKNRSELNPKYKSNLQEDLLINLIKTNISDSIWGGGFFHKSDDSNFDFTNVAFLFVKNNVYKIELNLKDSNYTIGNRIKLNFLIEEKEIIEPIDTINNFPHSNTYNINFKIITTAETETIKFNRARCNIYNNTKNKVCKLYNAQF